MSQSPERFKIKPAVYILIKKADKLLVLRRSNTGWADGKFTLPAGHVDVNETPIEAAVREVKEEIGLDVEPKDLQFLHVSWAKHIYVDFYFEARNWQGEPKIMEPEVCSEQKWTTLEESNDELIGRLREVLPKIEKGEFYSEIDLANLA